VLAFLGALYENVDRTEQPNLEVPKSIELSVPHLGSPEVVERALSDDDDARPGRTPLR
jgi:hypothetical protein